MDQIRIDNLQIRAFHGVYMDEKENGQNFFVNAVLYTDTRKAGTTDDLYKSTDYSTVCTTIKNTVTKNKFDLIETVAERVAEEILLNFPLVKSVDIEIKKPEAPIPMEFDSVSVKINRGWHDAFIAFGSNMGDSEELIADAMDDFEHHKYIKVLDESSHIITKPYGGVEQDDFVNGVCHIKTMLTPRELLKYCNELEAKAGRVRDIHWGPRTLDLDIILYDDLVYEDAELIIPHVDMENRDFVLRPMCELMPNKRHPILHKTMQQLLDGLN